MAYGFIGTMEVRPGQRAAVAEQLTSVASSLGEAGCLVYAVGYDEDDDDAIVVTEIWESKHHHDASLELPQVRASIAKVSPMLTGGFTRREIEVVGGLGV